MKHSFGHLFVAFTLFLSVQACTFSRPSNSSSGFDRMAFTVLGGTFFSNPNQLTMKEVHLDRGAMAGSEVIVTGEVKEISEHYTYVILEDSSARLLVVLTGLESAGPWLKERKLKHLRVMGTIESGKKGLPYIQATALNDQEETKSPS